MPKEIESAAGTIRFVDFEVDLRRGELRKHGLRVRVQDQPFKVLLALLEKPGEVVTRDELRNRIWGTDTFVEFDHGLNAAVNRLRESLCDSAEEPKFVETVARRGYRFLAPVEGSVSPASDLTVTRGPRTIWVCVAGLLLATAGLTLWYGVRPRRQLDPHLTALTALSGRENCPAFSPDGKQVAFNWNGPEARNFDLYVKMIGEGEPLRLTTHPDADVFPDWSPDGREIAFCSNRGGGGLYAVASLGGAERKLADLPCWSKPAWSRDGRFLVVARRHREENPVPGDGSLFMVLADGSAPPREVLAAGPGHWYLAPVLSPDSRALAFFSCSGGQAGPVCGLQVVEVSEGLELTARPRQIAQGVAFASGLTWTAGGNHLVFGSGMDNTRYLWRVGVHDGKPPVRLDLAGAGASNPDIDVPRRRLAFAREQSHPDIWRIAADGKAAPLLSSSLRDVNPQYSPDGRRIAFESERGGASIAVWTADADGSALRQVTRLPSPQCGTPRWSPNGRWIAFDLLRKGGGYDIWVVEENGGIPRSLTQGPFDNVIPSWSRDGQWVYFASNRTGRFEVWKVPEIGGAAVQVTQNGGYVAFESVDGGVLYYTLSHQGGEGIYEKGLPGGEERQLVPERITMRGFAVFPDGVYYLHSRGIGSYDIRFHEFATHTRRTVHRISDSSFPQGTVLHLGLSVSPDRKSFLFSKFFNAGIDLMMIENFE